MGRSVGWQVGCRNWERMVVGSREIKLLLSAKLAPGLLSCCVGKENAFISFLPRINMFILKKRGQEEDFIFASRLSIWRKA